MFFNSSTFFPWIKPRCYSARIKNSKNKPDLIHESQYTSEELKSYKGWGHSSYEQAIEVAERAGAKQLVMRHHDPDHDDEFLRRIEKKMY